MTTSRSQKLLILLVVLTTLVLIWQLSLLFLSQNTVSAATSPHPVVQNTTASTAANVHLTQELNKQTAQVKAGDNVPPQGLSMESANQAQYTQMVNEYQIAQMERLLAEENAAIAIAKRNAAQAAVETAKYLNTQPATNSSDNVAANPNNQNTNTYQLKYVDFQNQRWSAVLEQNGRFIQVNPGTTLPNGDRVTDISHSGVVLRNGHEFHRLSFVGADES